MTASTLPPCPCPLCGEAQRIHHLEPAIGVHMEHASGCLIHTHDRWLLHPDWRQLAKLLAAGLRKTGAQVHDNYETWESGQ